ncbi:MAG TPA: SMI1/KNR4 family protein [Azospirillaceae bacterium]|nr:SMI1/KNR4 family protein [Azospirillaceae bacterium]
MPVIIDDPKGPLSEAALVDAENAIGGRFPADYRRFMLEYNGGCPTPETFSIDWPNQGPASADWRTSMVSSFYAIREADANLVSMNLVTFHGRLPKGALTIGRDPGGNQILLGIAAPIQGQVMFWVKDYEVEEDDEPNFDNVGILASSFDEFLNRKLR